MQIKRFLIAIAILFALLLPSAGAAVRKHRRHARGHAVSRGKRSNAKHRSAHSRKIQASLGQ